MKPLPPKRLRVEQIVPQGLGLGRLEDGQIVLVEGVLPGDVIEVERLTRTRGALQATEFRVVEPSPDRREPLCPHAARCGGCDLMHATEAAQHRMKLAIVEQALRRTAGAPECPPLALEVGDSALHYRSRVRLSVGPGPRLGFRARSSRRFVPIDTCLVAAPAIDAALGRLARFRPEELAPLRDVAEVEIRAASDEPRLLFRLIPRRPARSLAAPPLPALSELGRVVVAGSPDDMQLCQAYPLAPGAVLEAPAAAFTQVNPEVNRMLVATVLTCAREAKAGRFVDVFAGAGNFTLPLLAEGLSGVAIDSEPSGIAAARQSAKSQLLTAGEFLVDDAERALRRLASASKRAELVVLDPPRRGTGETLSAVLALRPETLVMIACDPVTLARDLRTLGSAGGRITRLVAFDMFPQTHHVETLAQVQFSRR